MTLVVWTEKSGHSLGSFTEQVYIHQQLPVTNDSGVVYSIISGELPPGVSIIDDFIDGMPLLVVENTVFEFCIRAKLNDEISDRTFTITITANHDISFLTQNGVLPIGIDGQTYAIDDTYINHQLLAVSLNIAFGAVISYTLTSGVLPSGLSLSKTGILSGVVTKLSNEAIDNDIMEYTFEITITDGYTSAIGAFSIVVVGPEYLTADNEDIFDNTNTYTSDVSSMRPIQWVTRPNLGYFRADNFVTVLLTVIEPADVIYHIDNIANLPPGMTLNTLTGVLSGYVPVQVDSSISYSFSVTATHTTIEETATNSQIFTMTMINTSVGDITWPNITDLGTIEVDFPSMFQVNAFSYDQNANIVYAVIGGDLPPGLTMTQDGEILGKVNKYPQPLPDMVALTAFDIGLGTLFDDVETLFDAVIPQPENVLGITTFDSGLGTIFDSGLTPFDGNQPYQSNNTALGLTSFDTGLGTIFDSGLTPFDRVFDFTVNAMDQYGNSNHDFSISVTTIDENMYSNITVRPLLPITQRNIWSDFINNASIFTYDSLFRVNDPAFGVQTDLSMLIRSGIETTMIDAYVSSMGLNHKRKRFQFGSLNTAVASVQGTTDVIYEVVYVTMVDPLEINGKHLPLEMHNLGRWSDQIQVGLVNNSWSNSNSFLGTPDPYYNRPSAEITIDETGYVVSNPNPDTYYPSSVTNWRARLSETVDNNGNIVAINDNYLPLWMSSIQPNKRQPIGFSLAVPLCYCKAGTSAAIVANIKNYMTTTGFAFNEIDYTVDRYVIDEVSDEKGAKYLIFKNNRITI